MAVTLFRNSRPFALRGMVAIVFGVLAVGWLISVYAVASGVLLLAAAWRLRRPESSWRCG